ncbi:MAG: DUF1801 domain-containing protein [Fimbriimonadaceae bacterium]|nr:DUF1801 domain-containing protein [Fimbriimonadaceae bacterium]
MTSNAKTVAEYLETLPADRREAIAAVRETILAHLPEGFEEGMQYGMIGYYVPHSIYPAGYHCDPKQPLPAIGLASQKNHMSVYLFCIYSDAETRARFEAEYDATGKKRDMGAGCVRFRKLDQLPLEVLGRAVAGLTVESFIRTYEASRDAAARESAERKAAKKASAAQKPA